MTAGTVKTKSMRTLRLATWIAVQMIVVVLLLEAALRIARPLHPGLNALLYLPTVQTNFSEVDTTEELLGLTTNGFVPGKELAGFVLNSKGFRTPEYTYERGEGLRVVALGDSFTFAPVPHSQSWPVQLEEMLEASASRDGPVEVISLGVPAVGPQFYLRMWELEGQRLRPDIVVLGFFIGNDLVEEWDFGLNETDHGFWLRSSLAIRAVRNSIRLIRSGMIRGGEAIAPPDGSEPEGAETGVENPAWTAAFDPTRPTLFGPTYYGIEQNRLAACLRHNQPHLEARMLKIGPVLSELDRGVRSAGGELVVLLIPDEFQIDDQLSTTLLDRLDLTAADFDLRMPQDALISFFESEGIQFVDVLPEFRARAEVEPLYLFQDTHWSAAGNRLAAELVARYLAREQLIPIEAAAPETAP